MSCCGQKRAALNRREPSPLTSNRTVSSPPPQTPSQEYRLRYLGDHALSLTGMSGRAYYLPHPGFICAVAATDHDALLRTKLFEPETA